MNKSIVSFCLWGLALFAMPFGVEASNHHQKKSHSDSHEKDCMCGCRQNVCEQCEGGNPNFETDNPNWAFFGKNLLGWRDAGVSKINKDNVKNLAISFILQTTLTAAVTDSPAVVNDIAYYADVNAVVYAKNVITGASIWRNSALGITGATGATGATGTTDSILHSPTVGENLQFVGTLNGGLYALQNSSGDVIWSQTVESSSVTSPALLIECEDIVIFSIDAPESGTISPRVLALQASTGNFLWSYETRLNPLLKQPNSGENGAGLKGPGVVNTRTGIFYTGTGGDLTTFPTTSAPDSLSIIAINYRTGTFLWSTRVSGNNDGPFGGPVLVEHQEKNCRPIEMVIIGNKGGELHALNAATGESIWSTILTPPTMDSLLPQRGVNGAPATDGKHLYVSSGYLPVSAINTTDTTLQSLVGLFSIRLKDGKVIWQKNYVGTTVNPVTYSQGVVYFVLSYGSLTVTPPFIGIGAIVNALDARNGNSLFTYNRTPSSTPLTNLSLAGVTIYKNKLLWGYGSYPVTNPSNGGVAVLTLP